MRELLFRGFGYGAAYFPQIGTKTESTRKLYSQYSRLFLRKVENPVENVNNRPLKGLFFKSFAVWRTYIAVLKVYIRLFALYKSVKKVEDFAANFVQQ